MYCTSCPVKEDYDFSQASEVITSLVPEQARMDTFTLVWAEVWERGSQRSRGTRSKQGTKPYRPLELALGSVGTIFR